MSEHKIILHAPTPDALKRARANALNILAAEPTAVVEIIANGPAVAYAVEEPHEETDDMLLICENSLKKQNLKAPENIAVVSTSVLHIAKRQSEGWAYIRA